jgi:GNAT superfamily N-acetyltransferase
MDNSVKEAPLFTAGVLECVELTSEHLPRLQRFFEENPTFFLAVNGSVPGPNEAREQFESVFPAEWSFEKKWLLAFRREDGSMVGMADLVSNLFADGVWHIDLFIVATSLHGTGTAQTLYAQLESWMRTRGARWLRLGVVEGNRRAERFWERMGYLDLRRRIGVEMGDKVNNLRVMAKPLANGTLSEYLALVSRDRPESP